MEETTHVQETHNDTHVQETHDNTHVQETHDNTHVQETYDNTHVQETHDNTHVQETYDNTHIQPDMQDDKHHILIQPLQPVHYNHGYFYQYDSRSSTSFTNPMTQSFMDETWSIEKELDQVLSNISSIQSTQTQITISTSKRQEISLISSRDSIMESTRDLLNSAKDQIKSLELQDLKINRTSYTTEDVDLRNQRINHLKEKFVTCLDTYRNIEHIYMKQQKERLSRQFKIVNPNANNDEIEEYLKNPSDKPVFLQGVMNSMGRRSMIESKYALDEVNKRYNDIKKIEETITELVNLFKEIQLQVELKDDLVVSIASDIQTVESRAKEISIEMEQVVNSEVARSSRNFKCFCVLFSLIIFSIIILIIILVTEHPSK